ncbi:MAG: RNA 3'-terminal phosphate cyclase [Anaerolineales bacterium]
MTLQSDFEEDDLLAIDGSHGEGGGQLLRTSLSLAAVTGQAVQLEKIRANRSNPGLAPQHLTAVWALAEICRAQVKGDHLRSTEVTFEPTTRPQSGEYSFDVAEAAEGGSAGSVTLLAQALLPALALAEGTSQLQLNGGTHVRWSPSFHYLDSVYLPQLKALGMDVEAELDSWGFYPAGGGRIQMEVVPAPPRSWQPLIIESRGALTAVEGAAVASNLPAHIAQRMTDRARNLLAELDVPYRVEPARISAQGKGAGIFLTAVYESLCAGFTGHGELGKPAEAVAEEACQRLLTHHRTGAAVDVHLADQLLLPLSMAAGVSRFETSEISSHFQTNVWVLRQLLPDLKIQWNEVHAGSFMVEVHGVGIV